MKWQEKAVVYSDLNQMRDLLSLNRKQITESY